MNYHCPQCHQEIVSDYYNQHNCSPQAFGVALGMERQYLESLCPKCYPKDKCEKCGK